MAVRAFWMLCACGVPLVLAGQAVRELPVDLRIMVEEGPAQPIGELRDFAVAGARTFVLDFKEQVVHVYGSTGVFERSTGRKGSGPGEFRNANGLIAAPDGTVWVNDPGNARLTVLRGDGTFLRHHTFTANMYGYRWEGEFDAQRNLRVAVFALKGQSGERRTIRLGLDGQTRDTIPGLQEIPPAARTNVITAKRPGRTSYIGYPFSLLAPPVFDPRGFNWESAGPTTYEVRKVRDDRSVVATAKRDVPPVQIPPALRDAEIRKLEESLKGADHDADFSRIPRHFPFVAQMVVDDQSRLWTRRVLADSSRTEFDVFSPEGRFLYSARVPARLLGFGRLIVRGDAMYAVALDEDDLPSIIRVRIPR